MRPNDSTAFWARVNKDGPIPEHRPELGPCWLWPVTLSNPYGRVKIRGVLWLPHRFAYMLTHGCISADKLTCHHCDNPACVNPAHLFAGTYEDNAHDRDHKGRQVGPAGEQNGQAKLTEQDVIAIRQGFTGTRGEKAALARLYNVGNTTIGDVLNRKRWKDID